MSERYDLVLGPAARRNLHALPPRVAAAILEFLAHDLPENPLRLSKPLTGELTGLRSARRGDYRVLLRVDEEASLVVVLRIAHRADAYRPQ